jgi:hypothetical protein
VYIVIVYIVYMVYLVYIVIVYIVYIVIVYIVYIVIVYIVYSTGSFRVVVDGNQVVVHVEADVGVPPVVVTARVEDQPKGVCRVYVGFIGCM